MNTESQFRRFRSEACPILKELLNDLPIHPRLRSRGVPSINITFRHPEPVFAEPTHEAGLLPLPSPNRVDPIGFQGFSPDFEFKTHGLFGTVPPQRKASRIAFFVILLRTSQAFS